MQRCYPCLHRIKSLPETLYLIVITAVLGLPIATNAQIANGAGYVLLVMYQIKIVNIVAFAKEQKVTVPNAVDIRQTLNCEMICNYNHKEYRKR